mmetsp:Transcript_69464/g.215579  ORF Transcript_69464/g.215579 Transcript_69464/m.215579 type:complete len:158 (+) Transcript_69464:968-1441(+)
MTRVSRTWAASAARRSRAEATGAASVQGPPGAAWLSLGGQSPGSPPIRGVALPRDEVAGAAARSGVAVREGVEARDGVAAREASTSTRSRPGEDALQLCSEGGGGSMAPRVRSSAICRAQPGRSVARGWTLALEAIPLGRCAGAPLVADTNAGAEMA